MNASRLVALLVAVIIIVSGVGIFIFSRIQSSSNTNAQENVQNADTLLQSVIDIQSKLPMRSPEELMENITFVLTALYGEQLGNDALFTEVIRVHRLLFSRSALELNSFDAQYQNFMENLANHRADEIFQTNIEIVEVTLLPEFGYARAHISQHFNNLGIINWVYYLVEVDGGWKVETLLPANHNFVPFEN